MTTQLLKEAIVIAIVIAEKPSQMIRLEAYTLSNRVQYPIARLRLEAYTLSNFNFAAEMREVNKC